MADTWLTPDKKEGLLKYIEEGANEEDLLAAGYTKDNLTEVGWYQPTEWEAGPHHPEAQIFETVDTYTPTRRENLRGNVEGLLTKFGAPEGAAYDIATDLVGTENDVGLADFSPLGLVFGAQEGKRQIERGINAGDKSDIALGALNLGLSAAEAIPGVGALAKGVGKLANKAVKNYDPTVISAMGASHKVPSYTVKDPFEQDPFESFIDNFSFRDPLVEVFNEMEIPEKGLKGSQLIKELQDNPTVRNSQIKSQRINDLIDPQKRYTKEEIGQILSSSAYDVRAYDARRYESYQRQFDLVDKEVPGGYTEYSIEASNTTADQPKFKANNQHYQSDTLAHVRLSERAGKDGNYILVEELQSDLLQHGFIKPAGSWDDAKKEYLKQISDPTRAHIASRINEKDLKVYTTTLQDLDEQTLKDYYGTTDVGAISNDLVGIVNTIAKRAGLDPSKAGINQEIADVVFELSEVIPPGLGNLTTPPVAKTEETVRLGLQTAMAHANKKGLTKVVIPSIKKIVEKRFSSQSEIEKAMDPKSGFYATYVSGVNKVLRDLQKEFGDDIQVKSVGLEYDPTKKEHDFGVLEDDLIDEDAALPDLAPPTPVSPEAMVFNPVFREAISENFAAAGITGRTSFGRRSFGEINSLAEKVINRGDSSLREVLGDEGYARFYAFRSAINSVYPNVRIFTAFEDMANSGSSFIEALFKQIPQKTKTAPKIKTEQGIEIDFSKLAEKGYDLTKPKFAEGGAVTNVDPVSGNEIPPGSLPQEVRDDVDAKLSEGEYVLPADVVRYFGLDYIEKLVNKAKQGMEEFQSNGRIGGKTDEDLPFSPEELQAHEAEMASGPPQMAVGGLVPSAGGITDETTKPPVDPVTGLPWWLLQQKQQEQQEVKAPAVRTQSDRETARLAEEPKGLAGSVDKWSTKDFITYANTRGDTANRIIETGIASIIPLGGLALKARYKYLDKNVPTQLDSMIASGKDAAGNPISAAELAELKAAKEKLASSGSYTPGVKGAGAGLGGIFKGGLGNLFGGNKAKTTPATTPSKPAATASTSKPASTPTKIASPPSQAARAGFGKGGLITRR